MYRININLKNKQIMKHLSYAFAAMAALAFTACSQEDEQPVSNAKGYVGVMEGNSAVTRSYNGGNGAFKWDNGDNISVYTTSGFQTMTMTSGAGTDKAGYSTPSFIPKEVAVFPTTSAKSYADGALTVTYPSTRSAGEAVDDPMAAFFGTGSTTFNFKHLGGVVKFEVLVPEGVNKFVVSADQALAGDFTVDATDKSAPFVATTTSTTNNSVEFAFTKTTGSGMMTFILPMPTGTYTNLKVAVKNGNATVKDFTLSAPLTITRCIWYNTEINFGTYTGTIETMVSGVNQLNELIENASTNSLKDKDLTVDLNGETLTNTDAAAKNINKLDVSSISLNNGTIEASGLHIKATQKIALKDLKITGEFPKANSNARVSLNASDEIVVDGVDFSEATNYYNALEINLNANPVSKNVTVKNCKFAGLSNNAISVFGMPEDGVLNIENCEFDLNKNNEAIRISNKLNTKNFTINVKNCNYKYDTTFTGNKWAGFFLFEDYTTTDGSTVYANKPFAGLTINCENVAYNGVKVSSLNLGKRDNSQFACMCYDYYTGNLVEDASHFPTFTFK